MCISIALHSEWEGLIITEDNSWRLSVVPSITASLSVSIDYTTRITAVPWSWKRYVAVGEARTNVWEQPAML